MKKAKRNKNGMIVLYIGHDVGTYITPAGEFIPFSEAEEDNIAF